MDRFWKWTIYIFIVVTQTSHSIGEMGYRDFLWKDLCSNFVTSLLLKIFFYEKIFKPLPDLSVFCYSVSTSSSQENILSPKRSSFREIVLICIYHIPWFRTSLLFVVTTHWDLVTLFPGYRCSVPDLCACHACTDLDNPTGIFTSLFLRTWTHLCKTESCLVDPGRDIFKLSFSEQPNPPKSQWMGPHLVLTVTWFHVSAIPFSQRKIFC